MKTRKEGPEGNSYPFLNEKNAFSRKLFITKYSFVPGIFLWVEPSQMSFITLCSHLFFACLHPAYHLLCFGNTLMGFLR